MNIISSPLIWIIQVCILIQEAFRRFTNTHDSVLKNLMQPSISMDV